MSFLVIFVLTRVRIFVYFGALELTFDITTLKKVHIQNGFTEMLNLSNMKDPSAFLFEKPSNLKFIQ